MSPLPPEVIAADHALSRRHAPAPAASTGTLTAEEIAEVRAAIARVDQAELDRLTRQTDATIMLRAWANAHAKRDEVIRAAVRSGVPILTVHQITGIARTTIMRIMAQAPD